MKIEPLNGRVLHSVTSQQREAFAAIAGKICNHPDVLFTVKDFPLPDMPEQRFRELLSDYLDPRRKLAVRKQITDNKGGYATVDWIIVVGYRDMGSLLIVEGP